MSFEIKDGVLMKYTGSDTVVVIPEGVTSIDRYAFCKCSHVTEVMLPDSIRFVGRYTFQGCDNLEKAILSKDCEFYRRGDCYYDEYETGDYDDYPARLYCSVDDASFPQGCVVISRE